MSKKHTGIQSWRAPLEEADIQPAPSQEKKVTVSRSRAPILKWEIPASAILHSLLQPTAKQKAMLDAMFSGPVLLRDLLNKAEQKPKTPEAASFFLIDHHGELLQYLHSTDRTRAVELLKHMITAWAVSSPQLIELEFPSDCSISAANKLFFPIPDLGTLLVKDGPELCEQRRGMTYSPSFLLIHSPWGYIAEIEFLRREPSFKQIPASDRPARPPKLNTKEKKWLAASAGRIKFEEFFAMFDSAINARLMEDIRVSQRFVTPDFNAIEGRPVSGGLPSLPKHR